MANLFGKKLNTERIFALGLGFFISALVLGGGSNEAKFSDWALLGFVLMVLCYFWNYRERRREVTRNRTENLKVLSRK